MDLVFNVLSASPVAKSTSLSFALGSNTITCQTVGDVCAVQTALKAAKILGYSDRICAQINTKIDRALVAQGQANRARTQSQAA
jgi:hypothetical protein